MYRSALLATFLLATFTLLAQEELHAPKEFLGYEPGDRFTRHHRVVEYFEHVSRASSNVRLFRYGETYEHRPLIYAVVTAPENIDKIDQIREDNLRRTGLLPGNPSTRVAIVWLSYNVHGNEASSMEASMLTLYELVNPANGQTQEWLKNTVVIIDPCLNPDGRDRYANFYNQYGNRETNPSGDAKEHREPWPGGRTNHYLYDLNRDWAWLTQIESQQRVKIYNEWMPHVHVDFHEQGYNNPYFFAPAAEPFHEVISPWQREFQVIIGRNNAKYFDAAGWLYFTKEVFDLYYPSYGDTYPTYNGAVGMTYEQAGGGYAGLAITSENGEPLTLKDRLTHHHTTGLSTVEITAINASRVLDEFEKYYRENNTNPAAPYKTYVIAADNHPDKIAKLTAWLDAHRIQYGHPASAKQSRGFDFRNQAVGNVSVNANDVVISAFQPKSRLVTALFEPQPKLPDSVTYDITAWNLMYAYDLKAFALTERIPVTRQYTRPQTEPSSPPERPYAYIFRYQSLSDVTFLATLLKHNLRVRSAGSGFSALGRSFEPGTLVITRRDNESIFDFDELVRKVALAHDRPLFWTTSGFVDQGKDLGSSDMKLLTVPRVAMPFGEQTNSLSAGQVWHFFEQELEYPITQIGTDYFKSVNLSSYDVLILPEGNYRMLDESALEQLATWVSHGGKLIVIGSGLNAFADRPGFSLKRFASEQEKTDAEKREKAEKEKERFTPYGDNERSAISEYISGAIYAIALDKTHPLGFGMNKQYFTLKTNELSFAFLDNGWNVGVIRGKAKPIAGFAGYKANRRMDNSLVFGVEPKGRGHVVYLVDNPLFRSFWENGKMLFSNAVFMVGQ